MRYLEVLRGSKELAQELCVCAGTVRNSNVLRDVVDSRFVYQEKCQKALNALLPCCITSSERVLDGDEQVTLGALLEHLGRRRLGQGNTSGGTRQARNTKDMSKDACLQSGKRKKKKGNRSVI